MLENRIQSISDALTQLYRLLVESIVPSLKSIQDNQTEQRQQSDWLTESIEDFRIEMNTRFAELHAELASCRVQIDEAMAQIREQRAHSPNPKHLIH